MAKGTNARINERNRPKVTLSKEELKQLVKYHQDRCTYHAQNNHAEPFEHHYARARELSQLLGGWAWLR